MAMRTALASRRVFAAPAARCVVAPRMSAAVWRSASSSSTTEAVSPELNTKRADYLLKFAKSSTQREAFHYTSYLLAAGVPAAFILGGPVATLMDFALGLAIPLHFHIGMRSVLLDYVPNVANQKIALALLAAATVLTTLGLAKLNLFDVGLTEGVKQLFQEQSPPAAKARKEHQLQ